MVSLYIIHQLKTELSGFIGGMIDENDESEEETDYPGGRNKSMDPSVSWELDVDDNGWPQMPLETNLTWRQKKDVIRSFLTMTYSKFSLLSVVINSCHYIYYRTNNW
jgi:hypothetical protein